MRTVPELVGALSRAKAGETVFLPGGVSLDFTDRILTDGLVLSVPAGVTLASDRGVGGSSGAVLQSDEFGTVPLIRVVGKGACISGLRLRGPDPERRLAFHHRVFFEGDGGHDSYWKFPNSMGIQCSADQAEVENCEIAGWSRSGVQLDGGRGHSVHHCFIHHCQRMGLGYGVQCHGPMDVIIERNYFQANKHHIAGDGIPGSGYEARHNVVLPEIEKHLRPGTRRSYGQEHIFDMHGGEDRGDGTDIAGDFIKIHHNTVLSHYLPVAVRGVPRELADIHHNWFQCWSDPATVVRGPESERIRVRLNAYGSRQPKVA